MRDKYLFNMPRPDLIMKVDDPATSDNPLEVFLERKGWCLNRVNELRTSMFAKLTISFIKEDNAELTQAEKELQRDIEEFQKCGG